MNPESKNRVPQTSAGSRYGLGLWAILLFSMVFVSCQRTVTTRKRSYSIAGSGDEPDDSDEMKNRYASGFSIGEDGSMQTDKKDMYTEKSFRNTNIDKDSDPKIFRNGKKDFTAKKYNTPEYLNRQKDFRTNYSSMDKEARESDVDRFTTVTGDEEAYIKKNKPGFLDWLNPFSKAKDYQGADKSYKTSINRTGSRAVSSAATPVPMSQIGASPQEQINPSLSMDDVKKMLNPSSYRKQDR